MSCCSTDTRASRRPHCSVCICPRLRPTRVFAPAYSVAADSPVCAGLQYRCRLPCPHWLMPQPTHLLSGRVRWYPSKVYFIKHIVFIKKQLLSLVIFLQDRYKKVSPKGAHQHHFLHWCLSVLGCSTDIRASRRPDVRITSVRTCRRFMHLHRLNNIMFESPPAPLYKRHGRLVHLPSRRFTRPHRLTRPHRFTRPHWLTMPRPTHLLFGRIR